MTDIKRIKKHYLNMISLFLLFFCQILSAKNNYAVFDFKGMNISEADANVISEFVRNYLVNRGIEVVDRNNMQMILAEQGFQQTGCTDQTCVTKMGKILNVNKGIMGSFSKMGNIYFITVNLIDIETAKIISSAKVKFSNLDNADVETESAINILLKGENDNRLINNPFAKQKIEVKVLDLLKGDPIDGATVKLMQNDKIFGYYRTDSKDYVMFSDKKIGQYELEVTKPGYLNSVQKIDVTENAPVEVLIKLNTLSDEEKAETKRIHFLRAHELFKEKRYLAAMQEWVQILEIDPNHKESKEYIERCKSEIAKGNSTENNPTVQNSSAADASPVQEFPIKDIKSDKVVEIKKLLANGLEVDKRYKKDETALMFAAKYNSVKVIQLLIEKGADVNAQDKQGNTPLIYAVNGNSIEAVKLLLDKKADVTTQNKNKSTATKIAEYDHKFDILKLLKEYSK